MKSEADDNCSGSNSSQVSLRSVETMENHIKILDEEVASLRSRISDTNTEYYAWYEGLRTRLNTVIENRRELKNARIEVEEFHKTCDNVLKHLTELSEMLKSNVVKYKADLENKLETYEAQFGTLPLAVMITEAENRYSRYKVEMMGMEYEITELEEAVVKKAEIDIMRRNSLVVECAELFREATSEDLQLRNTLAMKENPEEENLKQEKMIAELTEKQSQKSAAASAEKTDEEKFPLFNPLQRLPQQQPELGETERKKPRII